MLNCWYKSDYIGVDSSSQKEQKRRVIKHNPANQIRTSRQLDEVPIDCTFGRELQNSKSRRIQSTGLDSATGLKVQNQVETPETSDLENPGNWIGSSRLDWLIQIREKLLSSRIYSTELDSGNSICTNSVLMKAYLCFKALQVQGPLDPICLDSKVRSIEQDQGLYRVQIRRLRLRQTYPLSLSQAQVFTSMAA